MILFIANVGIRYYLEVWYNIIYIKLMGKLQNKVKIKWSPDFAYAIGLLTTDGNLSLDGRHLDFTSQDREQLVNFMKCLGINNKIGYKVSGQTKRKTLRIQFGDIKFYNFLLHIGLMPAKSKILSSLLIPDKYFFDFLRGHFDGDGTFYYYWDPRWKSSFMFYVDFVSASKNHIVWLRSKIAKLLKIRGHITHPKNTSIYQLKYAKTESVKLIPKMYYKKSAICLSRKYLKIKKCLTILNKQNLI